LTWINPSAARRRARRSAGILDTPVVAVSHLAHALCAAQHPPSLVAPHLSEAPGICTHSNGAASETGGPRP
jgi:hypothetical protein